MFRRKSKESVSVHQRLHHRKIACISAKDPKTYIERILGREGIINISEDEFIVLCQNTEVFRKSLKNLEIAEFMSHDGFTVRDLGDPQAETINIYYTK